MSDYIYMLESRLTPDQSRAASEVQAAAGQAGLNLFLAGGAMRDMVGGFQIRDLDFVVEGNAPKLAKALRKAPKPKSSPPTRPAERSASCDFPSGVTAQIAHGSPGDRRPPRRQASGDARHHSGGSPLPRFHLQRHRPVAEIRLRADSCSTP